MTAFDYGARAELFTNTPLKRMGYRRFARASDAIQFAVEELPTGHLLSTHLQVEDERFDHHEIEKLYKSVDFPLARNSTVRAQTLRGRGRTSRKQSRV